MWAALKKHWFLAALATCFLTGFFGSRVLEPLLEMNWLRSAIVFAVMWAMGITLHADSIRRCLSKPLPSVLAILVNACLVPLLCLPAKFILPESLFGGLFVTAIVPCTLASAAVWTRRAGGDDSIALMTTVITNLGCVVVVPLGIWLVLSQQAEIDAVGQVTKLSLLVVLPLVVAQAMRYLGLGDWADRNKTRLGVGGQMGILSMVVFGAVASAGRAAGRDSLADQSLAIFLAVVAIALGIHVMTLVMGILLARGLGLGRASQIAVGIAGSQKTLMIGLQIAIDCGVSVIPMIIYHLGQLVIDTIVADRWRGGGCVGESGTEKQSP